MDDGRPPRGLSCSTQRAARELRRCGAREPRTEVEAMGFEAPALRRQGRSSEEQVARGEDAARGRGGGDTPCERALFRLFDAVEGLLDGEKRLFEPGDPVGDRLLCDACRVWSPMVRELSEGVDGFAYFREVYRLFRDS